MQMAPLQVRGAGCNHNWQLEKISVLLFCSTFVQAALQRLGLADGRGARSFCVVVLGVQGFPGLPLPQPLSLPLPLALGSGRGRALTPCSHSLPAASSVGSVPGLASEDWPAAPAVKGRPLMPSLWHCLGARTTATHGLAAAIGGAGCSAPWPAAHRRSSSTSCRAGGGSSPVGASRMTPPLPLLPKLVAFDLDGTLW